MPLIKSVATILSELYSQTNRAVMPQNDTIVATASNTIQRTPKVEPAGVRRVAFASKLFTSYVYEESIEEIRDKEDCFEEMLINKRARQREVAHFQVHGHWPEDVKPMVPTSNPPPTVREPPSKASPGTGNSVQTVHASRMWPSKKYSKGFTFNAPRANNPISSVRKAPSKASPGVAIYKLFFNASPVTTVEEVISLETIRMEKKGPLRRSKRIAALKKKSTPLRRSPRIASMKVKPNYKE